MTEAELKRMPKAELQHLAAEVKRKLARRRNRSRKSRGGGRVRSVPLTDSGGSNGGAGT